MAQVAVESAASGGALIGRPAEIPRMKRKTPSELRGEQLKRRTSEKAANDQLFASAAFDRSSNGLRNPEQQKISKYINTRVTEVFQVKKSRNIGKENCKDALLNNEKAPKSADSVTTSQSVSSSFPRHGDSAKLDGSFVPSLAETAKPGFRKAEKYSENALRSVCELHIGDEKQDGSNKFDMVPGWQNQGVRPGQPHRQALRHHPAAAPRGNGRRVTGQRLLAPLAVRFRWWNSRFGGCFVLLPAVLPNLPPVNMLTAVVFELDEKIELYS